MPHPNPTHLAPETPEQAMILLVFFGTLILGVAFGQLAEWWSGRGRDQ